MKYTKFKTQASINGKYKIHLSRLKELRVSKNLTMDKLGKDIGVTRSTISNLENEQRKPSLDMVIKLADYFQVPVDYLIGRTNEEVIKNVNDA